jgi:hypothetical protein
LDDLFLAPSGGTGFISPDLATNGTVKSGYTVSLGAATSPAAATVTVSANTCNGSADAVSGYFASADPVTAGSSGTRYFATDTRGTIFQDTAATLVGTEPLTTGGSIQPVQ